MTNLINILEDVVNDAYYSDPETIPCNLFLHRKTYYNLVIELYQSSYHQFVIRNGDYSTGEFTLVLSSGVKVTVKRMSLITQAERFETMPGYWKPTGRKVAMLHELPKGSVVTVNLTKQYLQRPCDVDLEELRWVNEPKLSYKLEDLKNRYNVKTAPQSDTA